MTISARASVNAGADQSGGITIVDGDVVQPKLADYTGVGIILWKIVAYPEGFSTPTGWTAETGGFYWLGNASSGLIPPSIDFTGAPWGEYDFDVTINNGLSGSAIDLDATRDRTLGVLIVGPGGMVDVPATSNDLENRFETSRLVWGRIQKALRTLSVGGTMPAGTAEGQTLQWDGSAWQPTTPTVINVKDPPYNAVGDGVTDDTAAFQAAFAAAAGGICYVPQGDYLITGELVVPSYTRIEGVGEGSVIEANLGPAVTLKRLFNLIDNDHIQISGLVVDGSAFNPANRYASHYAVYCRRSEDVLVENIRLIHWIGEGVRVQDSQRITVQKCDFNCMGTGVVNVDTQYGSSDITVSDLRVVGSTLAGVKGESNDATYISQGWHVRNLRVVGNAASATTWTTATSYDAWDFVINSEGNIYRCITAGVSASEPTGTAAGEIADGTCVWVNTDVTAGAVHITKDTVTGAGAFRKYRDWTVDGVVASYVGTGIVVRGASGVTIRDMAVTECYFGATIGSENTVSELTLQDCSFTASADADEAVSRYGLLVRDDVGGDPTTNLTIDNVTLTGWGQYSAVINAAEYVLRNLSIVTATGGLYGVRVAGATTGLLDGILVSGLADTGSAGAWAADTAYTVGDVVTNGGNLYRCFVAGTSDSAGGPTGTDAEATVTDNTCEWLYTTGSAGIEIADAPTESVVVRGARVGTAAFGVTYAGATDNVAITDSVLAADTPISSPSATPRTTGNWIAGVWT